MTPQEAQLVGPQIAEPGHTPLVEQRCHQRPVRLVGNPPGGLSDVPVVAQRVRTEVADDRTLVPGAQ